MCSLTDLKRVRGRYHVCEKKKFYEQKCVLTIFCRRLLDIVYNTYCMYCAVAYESILNTQKLFIDILCALYKKHFENSWRTERTNDGKSNSVQIVSL